MYMGEGAHMIIGTCIVELHANFTSSLKDKRQIVKSLIDKTQGKFNISIAEVDKNDCHHTIVLGFACVSNDTRHANSVLEKVVNYIETHTEAQLVQYNIEIL